MSAQDLIALLESQTPGTLLIVYNMLLGYPTLSEVISRQKEQPYLAAHWCVCCNDEASGKVFTSSDVVNHLSQLENPWQAALMDWSGAQMLDLSELEG
jgi:hypothetical protein